MEFSNNQLKLTAIIPVLNIFVAFVIAQKKKRNVKEIKIIINGNNIIKLESIPSVETVSSQVLVLAEDSFGANDIIFDILVSKT
jgi:hypothetical protein